MDFSLTDEQVLLLESLDEVLDRECSHAYIADLDKKHQRPVSFHKAMNDAGFMSLGFPEEYGGVPCDFVTMLMIGERVAKQGLNNGYGLEILQVKDILEFGNEDQKREVLGLLAEGQAPFGLGFTEPGAGSDNSAMKTSAVHTGGKVVFNGTKTLVTSAVKAKYLLTMARNPDAEKPSRSISMYLVPMDSPGVTVSPLDKIMWYTDDSSEIYLSDVEVDESCLVGTKGEGFVQLMKNFEFERLMIGAQCLGLAEAAFEDAARYAGVRVQFGQPIGNFQLIQEKLTDMAIKIENMRNMVYRGGWMVDQGLPLKTHGAMVKRYCAMEAFTVCDDSMQIHGGIGITQGTRISRLWRDARGHRFGGGTDEIMVHVIGRQIVKDFAS
ncbi:MAG: acyl-CoA dehydrogenase family protein [Dermatophilaceae bacterium]